MTIIDRLYSIRKSTKLTQKHFSDKVGVSQRAYANYERGDRELPLSLVVKLHDLYSINPDWLITGNGARTSDHKTQMMKAAILAVRSFAMIRKIEIDEDREAKLIVLLVEYFEKGGKRQDKFVENILETSTNER